MTFRATRRELIWAGAGLACLLGARAANAVAVLPHSDAGTPQRRIVLDVPSLVEEGGSLWLTVAVDGPMVPDDFVRTISLYAEGESERRAAVFHLSPEAGRAAVSTRLDLTRSQKIVAVAELSDATVLSSSADVAVAPSTCEDESQGDRPPTRFLVSAPATAKRGEVIDIKVLLPHPARTGEPHTYHGDLLQRNVIRKFACLYNGEEVFRADLYPAISANPFLTFSTIARASGAFRLTWQDEQGHTSSKDVGIVVEAA